MNNYFIIEQNVILCKDMWNHISEHIQDPRPLALTCKSLYGIITSWCNDEHKIQPRLPRHRKLFRLPAPDKLNIRGFMRSIELACAELSLFEISQASLAAGIPIDLESAEESDTTDLESAEESDITDLESAEESDITDLADSQLHEEKFSYTHYKDWSESLEEKINLHERENDDIFTAHLFNRLIAIEPAVKDSIDESIFRLPKKEMGERLARSENVTLLDTLTTIEVYKDFGRGTILRYLTNLEELISEGEILWLPETITYLTSLKHLKLVHCYLSAFPKEILQLPQLSTLVILNSIPMKFLSEVNFKSLANLQELQLQGCGLESLPAAIFELTNLTSLNFDINAIKSIPAQIENLTNLCEFSISDNGLEEISNELFMLPSLTKVVAWGVKLKKFPENLSLSSSLTHLNLSGEELEYLPPIHVFSNLRKLKLGRNKNLKREETSEQLKTLTRLEKFTF